mmetsp:Transcript_35116/g.43327  ORF Transcript_35116/g.43327 Transcript_35116/m.43327 type:complete len:203 (+) Transcript_35116:66-674(+)
MESRISEDEALIREVERTEEVFRIRKRLESCLRKGFVELSSGRFSKGFSDSLLLSASTFPEYVDARVTVGYDKNNSNDDFERFVPVRGSLFDESMEKISKSLSSTKINQFEISNNGNVNSELGLRRRQGKAKSTGTKTQPEELSNDTEDNSDEYRKRNYYLEQWLGYVPNGKLEDSRKAFEEASDLAIELANLVRKINSESL